MRPRNCFFVLYVIMEVTTVLFLYFEGRCLMYQWKEVPAVYTHIAMATIFGPILTGRGIIIFRLLPGIKSQHVKHVHALIYTIVLGGCGLDKYHDNYLIKERVNGRVKWRDDHHSRLYFIMVPLFVVIWVTGVTIFYGASQRVRRMFAPLHNFCGIVVFYLMILICVLMNFTTDFLNNADDTWDTDLTYANAAGVVFALVVIGIVTCPLFEWPMVGPL